MPAAARSDSNQVLYLMQPKNGPRFIKVLSTQQSYKCGWASGALRGDTRVEATASSTTAVEGTQILRYASGTQRADKLGR